MPRACATEKSRQAHRFPCPCLKGWTAVIAAAEPAGIDWQPWNNSVFEKAKKEHRFVLLDLEAVWCHWCHVMDAQTYGDAKVIALIKSRYIAVKVDRIRGPTFRTATKITAGPRPSSSTPTAAKS